MREGSWHVLEGERVEEVMLDRVLFEDSKKGCFSVRVMVMKKCYPSPSLMTMSRPRRLTLCRRPLRIALQMDSRLLCAISPKESRKGKESSACLLMRAFCGR